MSKTQDRTRPIPYGFSSSKPIFCFAMTTGVRVCQRPSATPPSDLRNLNLPHNLLPACLLHQPLLHLLPAPPNPPSPDPPSTTAQIARQRPVLLKYASCGKRHCPHRDHRGNNHFALGAHGLSVLKTCNPFAPGFALLAFKHVKTTCRPGQFR